MRVAGIMSGTSLDGIDVAIVDIRGNEDRARRLPHRSLPQERARGPPGRLQHDDPHGGHRAAALPAGRAVRRSGSRNLPPPARSAALDLALRHARPDDFSRRRAGRISRPPRREHAADRRGRGSRRAHRPLDHLQFPRARYRRGRPRRAAGPARRLSVVPASPHRPRRAEHRRHRQHHRDSRRTPHAKMSSRSTPAPATW